jgi:hypothetical protein
LVAIMGAGVIGDELGVETVGLVSASQAACVVPDPAGIDNAHPVACLMQDGGGKFTVRTGGLHDGTVEWLGMELSHPGQQLAHSWLGVVKGGMVFVSIKEQAGIEFGLGHIKAKAWVMNRNHHRD